MLDLDSQMAVLKDPSTLKNKSIWDGIAEFHQNENTNSITSCVLDNTELLVKVGGTPSNMVDNFWGDYYKRKACRLEQKSKEVKSYYENTLTNGEYNHEEYVKNNK